MLEQPEATRDLRGSRFGWSGMAAILEREAGYELLSLALIAVGLALIDAQQRAQCADRLITFALGVMARSMGAKKTPPQ
jgi:hypothetical protein